MKGLILAVCCALALLVPVAAADAASASSNKGRVAVGAKIKRFAVVDRKIVARGVLVIAALEVLLWFARFSGFLGGPVPV